ncbi:protein kinase-like domain-containing protein [Artemisia annua]|uniref:Protein kinase-like domain-containing protein n=1 Tax=Artemisia annua TaxID=35608 RepID=A0A2U1P2G1_ARTAN|nr:protein kinase-like domain-containing protein [Artemisia annua]
MAHMKQFEHLKISLEAIKSATNDFSKEKRIGSGGFGEVYKGEIVHSMGKSVVALKRLNRKNGQGDPEFWQEVRILSDYKHENIISLLGYCDECGERILVYKYASNESLERYLHNSELTWVRRLNICIGVARGLMYLHNAIGAQQRVLHRDIKSSNILLDENWNAKISDFGLSKLVPANQQSTVIVSNPVGTPGYIEPLYKKKGELTKESDVYSFGVMLFEVLCGRLCHNKQYPPLVELAQHSCDRNTLNEIIYAKIKDEISSDSLKMFTRIAYQCLMRDRVDRPLMTEVVKALEAALLVQFEHLKISLEAIKSATNDFSKEKRIGSGGFGEVYKGEIVHSMGKSVVALKRLNRKNGQGDPEFWQEVRILSDYKHENIISLLGYCDECGERILVYKYASNESLERYLHNSELTWVRRLNICIGVARGLMYLHNAIGAQQRVLHRDIKSSNILLDENWNAKISDFGLSKLVPANQQSTVIVSNPVGTPGYIEPLYKKKGELTKESDVYSFGVMLFEVLCGRLCHNKQYPPLVELAQHSCDRNTLNEIIYAKIKDEISSDSLKMFTRIAYQCLMRDRVDRPLMTEVVKALEAALLVQGLDHHVGTLNVKVVRIMNLKRILWFFERPSFVKVGLTKDSLPSKKTNSITSLNPEWNEEFSLVLKDLDVQALEISVWQGQQDCHHKMWMNVMPLKDLIPEQQKTLTLDLSKHVDSNHLENNSSYGQLIIELMYKPLTCEEVLTISEEAKEMNMPPKVGGWLVVTIIEAEDIQVTHPFVCVTIQNDKKQTKLAKKNCDPVWDEEVMFSFEKPPTNEILNLELHSSSQISKSLHLTKRGHVDISLEDIVKKTRTKEMYHLEDTTSGGRLHVELQWRTSSS